MSAVAAPPPALHPTATGAADSDGVWIAWHSHGTGEAVLMIMGFMGSSRAWFRLLPHVAAGHRAIVFDNRGTGDSDRPAGLWSIHDLVRDAVAVLDAAGEDTAHVIGASMGGMVAQQLALDHPERVRSLTLAATQASRRPGPPPWRMAASLALRSVLGPGRTFALVAPLLYSDRTRRERGDRLEEDIRIRTQDATPAATGPAQLSAILRHDVRERLPELRMPVLVIHGEEDRLAPPDLGRELAERIPSAELVLIPECGHVITTDAEERVVPAILDFIERCESERS
jgi:pimeloyl-ACP methyl ester carboxylesterase